MGFFPILMNILQFWIIDSIVKASQTEDNETRPSQGADDAEARAPFLQEVEEEGTVHASDLDPTVEEPKSVASTASSSRS